MVAAERLRTAVASLELKTASGKTLPSVTISIGVAESGDGWTAEQLLGAADEALYRAKGAGRNRVCE